MNTTDPIADMLTRIRNANSSKHKTVDVPASKIKTSIAEILFKEGFLFEDQYYMPPIICDQDNVYEVSSDLIGYYYYRTRKKNHPHQKKVK